MGERNSNRAYVLISSALVLLLCIAQIRNSTLLILGCLGAFTALMCFACVQNKTLPLLLFFVPWSPLLRINPETFSVYTLNLVLVCAVGLIKKWRHFKRYHIVAGILLLGLTLLSKLLGGSFLAMDYLCFMMLIFLMPVVAYEIKEARYDFKDAVIYLSVGVILASLCAQEFATYPNIAKYIRIASYSSIVRKCGFYGDPNFYVAQITTALSGCLVLLIQRRKGQHRLLLGILTMLLFYCGFLSGSKSFVLVVGAMLLVWMIHLLMMRGQSMLKITLIVCAVVAAVYISTSVLFEGLINILLLRFSLSGGSLDGFTTGRVDLWFEYVTEIVKEAKLLFLGHGYNNVILTEKSSHSTPIQMVYQFGILGTPVLLSWCYCFFKEHLPQYQLIRHDKLRVIILLGGIFAPWLAIDILFFDEFFLWQWFCVLGFQALAKDGEYDEQELLKEGMDDA